MTKHLKLKVKNTQLAAALQLNRKKKEEKKAEEQALKKEKEAASPPIPKKETSSISAKKTKAAAQETTPSPALPPDKAPAETKPSIPEIETPPKKESQKEISPSTPPSSSQEKKTEEKKKTIRESLEALKKTDEGSFEREDGFRAQTSRKKGKDFKAKQLFERQTFDARARQGLRVGEEQSWRRRRPRSKIKKSPAIETIRPKSLSISLPITVKDLAQEMKLKASELLSKLFLQGIQLTINDLLEDETLVQFLGEELGCEIAIDTSERERLQITQNTIAEEIAKTPLDQLVPRPPIIAFMGHVDHGKTSLVDAIRKTNIAEGEAGAITQHIGAFQCHRKQGILTILDTPGHEAFTLMRERGAAITDLIVLVIAGDEGIMPQTEEAIMQAKKANVPLLVAINKSDKPSFDADKVYRQLADHNLLPESWGGDVVTVNCSATTGEGISELLEMLTLQSEILELKANPEVRARGTVIESSLHTGFGPVATVLVQNGSLKLGDAIVFEHLYAKIKTMYDERGKLVSIAGPSCPVKITGLSGVPNAGCEFIAVKSEKEARKLCTQRVSGARRVETFHSSPEGGMEELLKQHQEKKEKKILNLVIRADVQGSLEAIKASLQKIKTKKVLLRFVSSEVGEISEADVELAKASQAAIIGFHTTIRQDADLLLKQFPLPVKMHTIIYHLIEDVKQLMLDKLDKIRQEKRMGTAEVKQTFKSSQVGIIAGCQVIDGSIKRSHHIKILRDKTIIWSGDIASIKREKEDVKEVSKGMECGILPLHFSNVQVGDEIQAFEISYIHQDL